MEDRLERLKKLTEKIASFELLRRENLKTLKKLYKKLCIDEKIDDFDSIFEFKAMNLGGISLNNESLGEVKEGKYAQIIGIMSVDEDNRKKMKNINIKYFGRAEKLGLSAIKDICEFVLRWRLEKSFRGVENYKELLEMLERVSDDK
ncbi:hypothetical protein [Nitrosophilus alvini]|uniref:hypothetical protein n=1 Tax=Nitrosophilus alvini TaxID=2714855 RepID=UPI00190B1B40|nr:hypothetical protein [Nitrosophilus alvini]